MGMKKELISLLAVVAVFVAGGTILLTSKILPEEHAQDFRSLSEISLQSEIRVIKEPTPDDNTYIYAINDVARQSLDIAQADERVKNIINSIRGSAVTMAAVQPTAFVNPDGKVIHSSAGQVIITSNWQVIDGKLYSAPVAFDSLQNKQGEAHQIIWNVFVDLDKRQVTDVFQENERIIRETLHSNLVFEGMNMYLPDTVIADVGSTVKWSNDSNLQHNVVGTYKTKSGSEVKVDSGFFDRNESWEYTFNEEGVFDYHCTIHSEEGMKGKVIVAG